MNREFWVSICSLKENLKPLKVAAIGACLFLAARSSFAQLSDHVTELQPKFPEMFQDITDEAGVAIATRKDPQAKRVFSASLFQGSGVLSVDLFGGFSEISALPNMVALVNTFKGPHRALWLSFLIQNRSPLSEYHGMLLWFKKKRVEREAQFEILRVLSLLKALKGGIFFRERVNFLSPPFLRGLKFLTYRFWGVDDDKVWTYSPFTKSGRELIYDSRSLPYAESPIALDDMMLLSTKLERCVEVEVSDEVTYAPVVMEERTAVGGGAGCRQNESTKVQVQWGYQERHSSGNPGWFPVSTIFAERPVIRVECVVGDPFSSRGVEIYLLDSEWLVPFYKTVLNKKGVPERFFAMGYHYPKNHLPEPAYVLGFDPHAQTVGAFSISTVRSCTETSVSEQLISSLTPSGLGQSQ
jgi:hypothetical protein